MRLVNIEEIEEGMMLAKPVYSEKGTILLQEGATLKQQYIPKIEELGYSNVYIQDETLKDLEVNDIVNEELRRESVNNIKETFSEVEKKTTISPNDTKYIKVTTSNLIEEIIKNKDLMVNMVDLKMYNNYTFQHSVNVAIISVIVGISMELDQMQLYKLGLGALLHDIGKTAVPNSILEKEGDLTEEEYEKVKQHSRKGYEILRENNELSSTSTTVALHHHERCNGEGYPEGKTHDGIHLFSRITAVADVFDALISDRPYRKSYSPSEAMEYILGGAGSLFDRQVVGHFFRKVATYPVGTKVKLSDGRIAFVIKNFEKFSLRPKIRVIEENGEEVEPYDIDLREEEYNTITITDSML
ncbi:HD-GYP domain-containing protein [Natranaerofaba carboxydovora]|uniref:HD-GYP domain-containing protein n=1 Tax=Natranaerofaba carboxydovora TaxID=2742683 RepID=UPI001F12DE0D|nr:HD-GYP domain-containing protein [Natranaerofaba carboxydovora]UMZ74867.1 Cyclic di-GMP phosphodiesterase response regulator RpfG [Natranaerofaba carboxydovora]